MSNPSATFAMSKSLWQGRYPESRKSVGPCFDQKLGTARVEAYISVVHASAELNLPIPKTVDPSAGTRSFQDSGTSHAGRPYGSVRRYPLPFLRSGLTIHVGSRGTRSPC